MKLGFDLRIMGYPPGGTRYRWARTVAQYWEEVAAAVTGAPQ